MSYGITPSLESQTPFAILSPSSSGVVFFDSATLCSSITSTDPMRTSSESYVEAALVHASTPGATDSGAAGFKETSHDVSYMRGVVINKSSRSGQGAFDAPHGDDLAISFGTSHAWQISGYIGSWSVNASDTAKSHAVLVMLR